jgi:hypothetical protein
LAFSYWTDKPWFLTEGKFAAVLIIPSSWGSQLDGDLHQHRAATRTKFSTWSIAQVYATILNRIIHKTEAQYSGTLAALQAERY